MKILQLILSGFLAAALASSAPAGETAPAPASAAESAPAGAAVHADDLSVEVTFDKGSYTLDDVIGSTVTVTNHTDKTMIFVKGSGSNTVPDALRYTLGGFVPLYKPERMTMDYRMDDLAPGETVTYRCDFVPYIPKDGLPGFGAGRDIGYFKTGDFNPAALGTTTGSLSFTYFLQKPGTGALGLFDTTGLTEQSVSIDSLDVQIVADYTA